MQHLTLGYLTLNAGPLETIDAAAAAGFKSVGIRITNRRVGQPYFADVIGNDATIREIRTRTDDHGLRLSNISAYHLFPDVTLDDMKKVIDTTVALGSKILVAHSYMPIDDRLVDFFASYTEYAARADVRIAVEFMRYTYAKTLDQLTDWLDRAGQPNAGYLLDPLHFDRAGGSVEDIRKIDPKRIVFVQLCDAKRRSDNPTEEQLLEEARNERLPPGQGDLPLYAYLDALPDDVEIEYEVPQPSHMALPVEERARRAAEDFHAFMAQYAASRGRQTPR